MVPNFWPVPVLVLVPFSDFCQDRYRYWYHSQIFVGTGTGTIHRFLPGPVPVPFTDIYRYWYHFKIFASTGTIFRFLAVLSTGTEIGPLMELVLGSPLLKFNPAKPHVWLILADWLKLIELSCLNLTDWLTKIILGKSWLGLGGQVWFIVHVRIVSENGLVEEVWYWASCYQMHHWH